MTRATFFNIAHSVCMALQGRDGAKEPAASWWHTDQAPRRTGLHCIQGLLNITDVGPQAGEFPERRGGAGLAAVVAAAEVVICCGMRL